MTRIRVVPRTHQFTISIAGPPSLSPWQYPLSKVLVFRANRKYHRLIGKSRRQVAEPSGSSQVVGLANSRQPAASDGAPKVVIQQAAFGLYGTGAYLEEVSAMQV